MSTCFQIEKGIFVSLTELQDLYEILIEVDDSKKTEDIKYLESYIKYHYCTNSDNQDTKP